MARSVAIAPSILPADFSRLGEACIELEKAGADRIHLDVMDGVFVPNLTFGPPIIKSLRPHVSIPFEAHLMVVEPDKLLPDYVNAGCETVMVQVEACTHLHRTLALIADLGARPGAVLNPATPLSTIEHVLDLCDIVLLMTVNPGFGGQKYLPSVEPKIAELRAMIDERGLDIDLEVDGGIGAGTIEAAASAGANAFVAGSAVFNDEAGFDHAIENLRTLAGN
ncbi:MAG: ribulose-phosphate 3-epimerase [Acidimicrobiales bacterium]|nr:ribulose-phosphate 3-epimerase [Acidimicrobiales bacterium]